MMSGDGNVQVWREKNKKKATAAATTVTIEY